MHRRVHRVQAEAVLPQGGRRGGDQEGDRQQAPHRDLAQGGQD